MSRVIRLLLAAYTVGAAGFVAGAATAQDVWLQIEAQPSRAEAVEAARDYAGQIEDVAGFRLGSSAWYAITVGPLTEDAAAATRSDLRRRGLIPGDSFVTDGQSFGTRFWPAEGEEPAGVDTAQALPDAPDTEGDAEDATADAPSAAEDALADAVVAAQDAAGARTGDTAPEAGQPATEASTGTATGTTSDTSSQTAADTETVAEARQSERALDGEARRELQRALRRLGFYRGPIDGAFGRSTRAAMSDWQTDVGADPTGVLTTAQRAALARAYAARVEEEGPAPVYETVAEARQSEAGLSGEERRALQRAMQWAGVYDAAIDGAFGRGTRAAMGDWQARKGYDVTGVLTTRQRDELMADYNAILEGLGLDLVRDDTAGIEMRMPTALVEFSRYEPPFAHYDAIEDGAAYRVLLISQDGDGDTLAGLYDVMQTLEIVPQDGPRDRDDTVFRLEGQNADFVSHTEAGLVDGSVKGFTLIWPRGDEERRARVLDEMRQSFAPIPGVVMPDRVGAPDETQRVDLLAGLQIRRPELSRSGFYVDAAGMVLTTSDILGSCGRITLDEAVEAEIAAQDDASGLALLRPQSPLSPSDYARLQTATPRLQSEVAVSGFSYEGVLGAPSLTFGRLADLRGLDGADTVRRLEVGTQPGDAGGPVLDATGAVLGMLLPRNEDGGRVLPDGVSFAADSDTIAAFLGREGVQVSEAEDRSTLNPDQLGRKAGGMTVLVSCWD